MTIGAAAAARRPKIDWPGEDKWQLLFLGFFLFLFIWLAQTLVEKKGHRVLFSPGSMNF